MAESSEERSVQSGKSREEIRAAYDEEEATSYAETHWLLLRRHEHDTAVSGGLGAARYLIWKLG